jgi:hypothetical protein
MDPVRHVHMVLGKDVPVSWDSGILSCAMQLILSSGPEYQCQGCGPDESTVLALCQGYASPPSSAPAGAPVEGQVCMFNAPLGGPDLDYLPAGYRHPGHVGWAYQRVGTSDWTYGATENGPYLTHPNEPTINWEKTMTFQQMLDDFKGKLTRGTTVLHQRGYYTRYRCISTTLTSLGAADAEVGITDSTIFDGLTNNCLTRSILIFQAYSNALDGLNPGTAWAPNYYFQSLLTGFGPIQYL